MTQLLLSVRSRKLLLLGLFLHLFSFAAPISAFAQEEETQSVADMARAARASHAQPATAISTPEPHPPFSQTQLLAWLIAGVSAPDLLNQLKADGIAFPADAAHLNPLKEAQLPAALLAALPSLTSSPEPTGSAGVPQALIYASQAYVAKDFIAARYALEILAEQAPDADVYAALGNLNFLSQDLPSARSAFEHAVQLDPSFVYAHLRLAGVYYAFQDGAHAAAEAKAALRLHPDNAQARRYLAQSVTLEVQSANSSQASGNNVEDLSDLMANDGSIQDAKDLDNRGIAFMQQQEWRKAEAAFRGAIDLNSKVALFYYNLGNLYVQWGNHDAMAFDAYRQAKALAPRNLAVRQTYAAHLCKQHVYNEAINEFREILDMDPSWNAARPCLYAALFNTGRREEAAQVLADYRYWNQVRGLPDDSEEIEATQGRKVAGP
ncbi:MAG TPA: hypothetical protein VEI54_03580 [Candidatus Limnocylindrales bacterium]|nr:hypothetical protein [Candidatus Limnocylindrales bacterium]